MMKAIFPLFFLALLRFVEISHASNLPFTLGIRDSIMIAHSFHENPAFGPAGKMVRINTVVYQTSLIFPLDKLNIVQIEIPSTFAG